MYMITWYWSIILLAKWWNTLYILHFKCTWICILGKTKTNVYSCIIIIACFFSHSSYPVTIIATHNLTTYILITFSIQYVTFLFKVFLFFFSFQIINTFACNRRLVNSYLNAKYLFYKKKYRSTVNILKGYMFFCCFFKQTKNNHYSCRLLSIRAFINNL